MDTATLTRVEPSDRDVQLRVHELELRTKLACAALSSCDSKAPASDAVAVADLLWAWIVKGDK